MVSAINFNGTTQKGFIKSNNASTPKERVVILDREPDGFIRSSFKSVAYIKKAYVTAKEGIKGLVSTVASGLAATGAVLGLSWILQKAAGRGVPGETWLHPLAAVGSLVGNAVSKVARGLTNGTAKQILAYPFTGFFKDVYKYVKNANGCGTAGKVVASAIGLGVVAFGLCKTMININKANAEVDHEFAVGHNA